MENEIENIRLKFNCPADWEAMEAIDGVRYCTHCQKNVYDFTDAKRDEFLLILAENGGNICGRFRIEQTAPLIIKLPSWKKWVSAALVLIGINVFSDKANAQNKVSKSTKSPSSQQLILPEIVALGRPMIDGDTSQNMPYNLAPRFVGGDIAYQKFLKKNLQHGSEITKGRVFIMFDVNRDGSLSNYQLLRYPSLATGEEVLRVFKLSPKWKPAMRNNKPVKASWTLLVVVDK